jgi:hypothetical protein
MGFRSSPRFRAAAHAAVCLALVGITLSAMADGPPVLLDTQTGVHDGQSGLVLQNAPLSREPMVPMQQLAAPTQVDSGAANGQPPIVVAPYIALPGPGGAAPPGVNGYRMRPANPQ